METYFEILPKELIYLISRNLRCKDLISVKKIININIDQLFAIVFPKVYKDVSKILNTYKYMFEPHVSLVHEIIYMDLLYYDENVKSILNPEVKIPKQSYFYEKYKWYIFNKWEYVNVITSNIFLLLEVKDLYLFSKLDLYPQRPDLTY